MHKNLRNLLKLNVDFDRMMKDFQKDSSSADLENFSCGGVGLRDMFGNFIM